MEFVPCATVYHYIDEQWTSFIGQSLNQVDIHFKSKLGIQSETTIF